MSGLTSSLSILAVMLGVLSPMAVAEAQVQPNTDVIVRSAKRNPAESAFVHLMRETTLQSANLDTRQSAVVVRSAGACGGGRECSWARSVHSRAGSR